MLLATVALTGLLFASPAAAQSRADWTGVHSTDWFDASNWNTGNVPDFGVGVYVDTVDPHSAMIDGGDAEAFVIYVGDGGEGELTIKNGGTLESSYFASIGEQTGSEGTVLVTGTGSAWVTLQDFLAGDSGKSILTIANGGQVRAGGDGFIGNSSGGEGTVVVTGTNSTWDVGGNLAVGEEGRAALTIRNGGLVEVGSEGVIGAAATGEGSVKVADVDSTWDVGGDLIVGDSGNGTLTVSDGGQVSTGDRGYIGNNATGRGTVLVTGTGSTWRVDGTFLLVGNFGEGTLSVTDGAEVSVTGLAGIVGSEEDAEGTVLVTGPGTTLHSTDLIVGGGGKGTLTLADSALVETDRFSIIGGSSTGEGSVEVSGARSTWDLGGNLAVGQLGSGTLTIADGGLVETGSASFLGYEATGKGSVTVTGPGSTWDIDSDLTVGDLGQGTLTVAEGGAVAVSGELVIAEHAGSKGTVNIGGAGPAAVAPGALDADLIHFGDGDGRLILNHTAHDHILSADLDGAAGQGQIDVVSGVTSYSANGNGFDGETVVSGTGTMLLINGALGGTLEAVSGGTLGGSGTIGTTTLLAGGLISPGNSIGTLKVEGDYIQEPGSTYFLEVDRTGNSDLLTTTGSATLNGGLVQVEPVDGYLIDSPYHILSAGDGITGEFDEAELQSAFLGAVLDYETNDLFLTITQVARLSSVGETFNQIAAAAGAETLDVDDPVWKRLIVLDADRARQAFDTLSGELHASAKASLLSDSRFVRNAALGRVGSILDGEEPASSALALLPGEDARSAAPAPATPVAGEPGIDVWHDVFGSWGRWKGDGNAATFERSIGGLFLGADLPVGHGWRLGLAGGYSHASFDAKVRTSSGARDDYHVTVYGGTTIGGFALRLGSAYSWHDFDTMRYVAFPGFAEVARANYSGSTAQVFGETGYRTEIGMLALEPFAGLAHVNAHVEGFAEEGGKASLAGLSDSEDVTYSTLGLRAEAIAPLDGGTRLTAHGTVSWQHAISGVKSTSQLALPGGAAFTVAGAPIAEDVLMVEAGLGIDFSEHARLQMSYGGQLGGRVHDHGVRADLSLRF